ncbi:CZB domain-containing protein [Hymenobacter negativus]|uniref:CZB domain-containing protein n=1 Tax=Hymenobacter negativus TaxID=2795026 RepID=A0ABS3QQ03_9BACT|nr:CZB domain-containing protein [Hymenobacter negativus]MBO2013128.1 CZB domain-containing protein [Hymenobacter negativus]
MTREELKRDLESAVIKHVHFKSRLRSFLFGNNGAEGPLRDPEQCSLGIWIADRMRGNGPYAHLPEAALFDRQHLLIHREANRLMDMYELGQTAEAGAGYEPVQAIADTMVELLRTMEDKLRREI